MQLSKIISISGKPGLFEVLKKTKTGIIAKSIVDNKKIVTNLVDQISVLSEIKVYGLKGEVPLIDVFKMIYNFENGFISRIKPKSEAVELESYFFDVFNEYDEQRVYPSDIKKIIQWYNLLFNNLNFKKKKSISIKKQS
jgi:hypothetical protein